MERETIKATLFFMVSTIKKKETEKGKEKEGKREQTRKRIA